MKNKYDSCEEMWDDYYKEHKYCPKCHSCDNLTTSFFGIVSDPSNPQNYVDTNTVRCNHCGWVGLKHDMVGEELVNVANPQDYNTFHKHKYDIGDIFTKRGCRDCAVMEITEITYGIVEPIYKLSPVKGIGEDKEYGEAMLDEVYIKFEKK